MNVPKVGMKQIQALISTGPAPILLGLGEDGRVYIFNWIDLAWQHVEAKSDKRLF